MENNNNAAANSNVNTEVNNNPAGANAGTTLYRNVWQGNGQRMSLHLRNCGKRS